VVAEIVGAARRRRCLQRLLLRASHRCRLHPTQRRRRLARLPQLRRAHRRRSPDFSCTRSTRGSVDYVLTT